ncbi:glycosyltransferase family 22 protein [Hydnomerulius pinastri MD-312]|uniref:Mannosyltransferase n=1 Tax=Hydnomerulius pinastri MD-312 TaxID=994086 RepID=A0A0C9WAB6_9AGAM|nr:glycosyltransferase family 22 protein [Hydnomerulius pinastri MD-312]
MSGLAMDLLLVTASWTHVLLAPYSKVEESFNFHATLRYPRFSNVSRYDHSVFLGAVPWTFIGSIKLAWIATPFVALGALLGLITSKFDFPRTVVFVCTMRLVLASLNAIALIFLQRPVSTRFGRQTSWLFTLPTCSQFHIPFWMGRTLHNMFALIPVNFVFYALYNRAPKSTQAPKRNINIAIALLTFTAVIFRSEVALLLGPLALQLLVQGRTKFANLVKIGLLAGLASIALTIAADSYFWDQWPLWPELYGIYFNVYLGKSSDWGITADRSLVWNRHPPRDSGRYSRSQNLVLAFAPIAFVFALSAPGHKKWRFAIYVVPLANIAAARGARWL